MLTQLLVTKFFIPLLSARRVSRPRLMQRLSASLDHRIPLVSAPAGFGKTLLLGEWAQRASQADDSSRPIQVAWVSLDDYHLITAPPIHDSLTFLLDHLPPCLHIVLASRADPPLPLARLRAHNCLLEM